MRRHISVAPCGQEPTAGDRGGIKFQGKVACPRDDGCVNTLTAVLKDNLIVEVDYAAEPRTTQT